MIKPSISIKGKLTAPIELKGKTNVSIIKIYPELEDVEITPTIEDQIVKSDMYGFGEVKVKGVQSYIDEDIKPEYIKEGVDILGVVGNVVELQGEEKTITPTTEQQIILPSEGKNAVTKITVEAVDNTIDEDIKPEHIVEGVEILGVTGNYKGIDTSDATVTPEAVLEGETIYINNEKVTGTMPNNGELEYTPFDEEQAIPTGYTSGGTVKAADITTLEEYDKCLTLANSIDNIDDYTETTATPADIIKGKTAYSNGERIVGTFEDLLSKTTSFSFQGNTELTELIDFDMSFAKNLNMVFQSCTNLKTATFKNTQNVIATTHMFRYCSALEIVEIDTSKVSSMNNMFHGCTSLIEAPKLNINVALNLSYLYSGCTSLVTIPEFEGNVYATSVQNMFENCPNLSDESLNNILALCVKMKSVSIGNRTLKYIGLTEEQAIKCESLSNYQAFYNAGWRTGY